MEHGEGHRHMARRGIVLHDVQQQLHRLPGHGLGGLVHGGQPGDQIFVHGQSVEADDAHVAGDLQSVVLQGPEGTNGHQVGHGEDGGIVPAAAQQLGGAEAAPIGGEIGGGVVLLRIDGQAVGPEGILNALPAHPAGVGIDPVPADDGDFFVAQSDQGFHRLGGGLAVVDEDTGKIGQLQRLGAVGHEHPRDPQLLEFGTEILQIAAQEDDTQGPLLPDEGPGPADLVFRPMHVFHVERIAGAVEGGLDDLQHFGKENVAAALQDHQNGGGVALLELLGILVELKAALLHGGQDGSPGLLTDVGVVVQDSGNGADSIARLCGQILDCHIRHLLFGNP